MRDEVNPVDQIRTLTERLEEAEETLRAVRSGEIDAFIVQGPGGEQVYALRSAEQPYRNLIEDMLEGAAILTVAGDIAYCNKRFAELVSVPLEDVVGGSMERFIFGADRAAYRTLLQAGSGKRRVRLTAADGWVVDVLLSFTTSVTDDVGRRNLIVTDLSELLARCPGVVILATNLKANIDEAFARRFQSMIYFSMPGPEQRLRIWEQSFPAHIALEDKVNLEDTARKYEMTGGTIINVVRYSCLMALKRGDKTIRQKDVLAGIRKEFGKDGKIV